MSGAASGGRSRALSGLALSLGVLTLATAALLLLWNLAPGRFPARAHDVLGALPLAVVALACVAHQASRPWSWRDMLKASLLAAAFLFWAGNQLWPEHPRALLMNDVAIVLFVLDVVFVILGWPAAAEAPPGATRD
jgi:hypothetical protein